MRAAVFLTLAFLIVRVFAQDTSLSASAASRSPVEIRKEASELLMKQDRIELTKYKDGGILVVSIFPSRMEMQTYREAKECFPGVSPIEKLYVNSNGYLTIITRARVRGCSDSRINIDPIGNIAGSFEYNVDTQEQSKSSTHLYLRR